jgi:ribosomal protein S1
MTGETPSGQTTGQATTAQVTPVTATDVKKGASVYDASGARVGKIVSVSSKGAVVSTGKTQATVPLSGLGMSDKRLIIGMSKDELEAAAKKSPK